MNLITSNNSFNSYLKSKNIKIVTNIKYDKKKLKHITEDLAIDQLYNISLFHKLASGYENYVVSDLENKTGKMVEKYKVELKRVKRLLNKIKSIGCRNRFEEILLKEIEKYIKLSDFCLKKICNDNYINLIYRSMKKTEVCLGNIYFDNLTKNESIEIKDFSSCCYNMVEFDCIDFLYKLKKKNLNLNMKKLSSKFCEFEGLTEKSNEFILSFVSYPYSVIKCCNRYIEDKKNWDEDKYIIKFKKAMDEDKAILI